MAKSIKVGVITNATGAHLDAYLPALAAIEEVSEVALADPSGKMVELARKRVGDKLKFVGNDVGAMLKQTEPQMALVSVAGDLAPPLIDSALEAGCHVFAEKPSCVRAEDFAPLAAKAEQKHRHLMLALANRVNPLVQEARRMIRDKMLGKIYAVEVHFVADQARLKRESYRKEWYCSKARAGGGHLIWLGIHWLDLVLYMTGMKVEQVAGFAGVVGGQPLDVEDSAAVALRFENGCFGTMTSGYYLDRGKDAHIQIWGEYGWIRIENPEDEFFSWYCPRVTKEAKVQRFQPAKGPRGYPPFVRAAVRACAGLEPAPITPAECLHVLKTIFACYRAAQSGRTQKV